MTFYQNEGLGCVVMANSDEGDGLIKEMERAVAREYDWPDYFPKERTEAPVRPDTLDALVGQYSAGESGVPVLIVHRRDHRLMARLFGQRDAQIYPESEDKFFWKSVDAEISFERKQSGAATGLILYQNQGAMSFHKFSDKPFWGRQPLTVPDCRPRAGSLLQGCWKATLGAGAKGLLLIVRIAELSPGKFEAELDSVDQKALGQALSVVCHRPQVELVVMAGYGMFVGEIKSDGAVLVGDWVQDNRSIPLTFERFDLGR